MENVRRGGVGVRIALCTGKDCSWRINGSGHYMNGGRDGGCRVE